MEKNLTKKSFALPLVLSLKGEIVGSQKTDYGTAQSSLLMKQEGALPAIVVIRSQGLLKLGPFEQKVRLMVEKISLVEKWVEKVA